MNFIRIDFEFETKYGTYRSALNLPDDHTYSDTELEDMKNAELQCFLNLLENPSVDVIEG